MDLNSTLKHLFDELRIFHELDYSDEDSCVHIRNVYFTPIMEPNQRLPPLPGFGCLLVRKQVAPGVDAIALLCAL